MGMNGSFTGREPAAMMALSKVTVVLPSAPSTSSVFGPVNLKPFTTWTLRILAMPARPPVSWLMTFSFHRRTLSMSVWGTEDDAVLGQRLGFFNDFGDVQQCLGRDATHVQADATQGGVTLDDNGIQTQVSRTEGSGITGRASTQYYDLGFDFFTHHDLFVVLISPDSTVLCQTRPLQP